MEIYARYWHAAHNAHIFISKQKLIVDKVALYKL